MSTTARPVVKKKIDVHEFVDHIREVNEKATGISMAFLENARVNGYLRWELDIVLGELEKTMEVLRAVTIDAQSAINKAYVSENRRPTSYGANKNHGAGNALVSDATNVMIKKGQLLSPVDFQSRMGWSTRQAVSKAAQSNRVFYLTYKSERYFPAFYSDPSYDRKHLETVTKMLGDLPGGSKLQFFMTRKGSLGGKTPLQALAAGRVAKVKDVAAAFAEVSMEA